MPLTKSHVLAVILISFSSSALSQDNTEPMSVADKIRMAEFINGESINSDKAAVSAQRISNENEVRRLKIEAKALDSQLSMSVTEIEQMKTELDRYRLLLSGARSTNEQPQSNQAPMRTPRLSMKVLNILSGENITTRARVAVLAEDGSTQAEFQLKKGSSVQGWSVDSITPNSIIVSKNGQQHTYGSDGIM
jgi:type II secretory pathway component PulC